jgi:hypothetical protein
MVDSVTDIANNTTTKAADRYIALSIVLTRYIELMTFSALNNLGNIFNHTVKDGKRNTSLKQSLGNVKFQLLLMYRESASLLYFCISNRKWFELVFH